MKSINIKSIIMAIFFCFLGTIMGCGSHLAAVTPIEKVEDIESQKGVFYSLPKTVIKIEIPIIATSKKPGPLFVNKEWFYKKVAEVGVGSEYDPKKPEKPCHSITQKESTTYSIGEAAVSTISTPDEKNTFFVKLDSKIFEDLDLTMNLSQAGLLESAISKSTNRAFDIGVKVLESAASIAGKVVPIGGEVPTTSEVDDQITAINRIRISRLALITGTAGTITGGLPAETLRLMLGELDKKEKELMNALRGTTTKKQWTAVFEFEPDPNKTEEHYNIFGEGIKLLSYSDKGLSELSHYCINSYNNTLGIKKTDSPKVIKLKLSKIPQPALKIPSNEKNDSGSFFYRIPLLAKVELTEDNKTLMADKVYLAQFGPIRRLPETFKSKTGTLDLTFYTDTGSIHRINTQTTAIVTADEVGRLGTSATELTGKIVDKEKDELTREKDILELKKTIRDLEKELDQYENNMS